MTDTPARLALETLPLAVSVFDADGRLLYANPAFWRGANLPEGACAPGTPLRDVARLLAYRGIYGPGDPEAQIAAVMAVDRSRPSRRQIGAINGARAFEALSAPLPGGGFVTVTHEITALFRAREEQAARARLLESTLARLGSGVARFDKGMQAAFFNPAYEALHGLPGGSLRPGMTHRDIIAALEERGEYASTEEAERIVALMEGDRAGPSRRTRQRPSGEVLRFDTQPAPDGGFIVEVADITALKRAEDEANRRAALLDGVLEAMPHGVCIYDADLRVQRFNAAYAQLMDGTGVTVGERLQDVVARRIAQGEYDAATAAQVLARYAPDMRAQPPMRRVRPNGHVIENSMARLPDGGIVTVFTDVTALHQAEAAERRRAALLEGVVGALPHGVCVYGPDRRVAMFNDAYARIMDGAPVAIGDHAEEVAARRVAQGEFPADYAAEASRRRLRDGDWTDEAVRRRPNGKVIAVRAAPLPDGGHISVVTDVTAVHHAEAEARSRAELLDAVIHAMPVGVCVYGADRRARITNAAYRDIFGDAAVRLGESIEELGQRRIAMGEQSAEMGATLLSRHLGPPDQAGRPIHRVRPNGTAIVTRAGRLPDGGHIAVISDVTALHRAEEELRRRAALLEASFAAVRHGIAIYGPDRRLLARNDRVAELTGVGLEHYTVGRAFEELVDGQVAAGILTFDQGEFAKRLDRGRPHRDSRLRPDGRIVEILNDPTPDGGFVITFTDITALRRAEAELRHRAAILEASFTAMRHGIALWGPDRRLLAANERALHLMGVPPDWLRPGQDFDALIDEQVARGVLPAGHAAQAKAHDRSRPYRSGRRTRDGRILEIFSDPTPDGGFVVTFTDVTAQQRAEAEARRRAQLLETSFAAIRHGIAVFGPDRRLLAWNDQVADLTGVPLERHAVGRSFESLLAEQVSLGILDAATMGMAMAVDRARPFRSTRTTPDGRLIEVLSDPTPDGGFVVTFTDVTALHRAEQELRQRAAMQEAMLSNIRHGIILYGPDRRLLATNATTAELTGMPAERLAVGRTMDEMVAEQVARGEVSAEQAASMLALDRSRPQRYGRIRGDGRVLDTVSEPTPDGGYVITYSDVTEDRRIRAELENARARAEAASEAKSRFLATMSHELRTPLNAVIGLSEAITPDGDGRRIAEYAAMINEAGRHLLQLVDDILDVARSQTGALETTEEPLDVGATIAAATAGSEAAAAAAGLTLSLALPADLPALRGDARRLRQVLDKLLSNAVKFTPAGGRITLSAAVETEGLALRVADTGIGIPPEERERMFEPFTQLDSSLARRFPGSGLGLHLARTLAAALGATLTLEDPDGPGLVAVLRFPAARLLPAPAPSQPRTTA